MQDSIQTENTIIIDGKVNLEDYKIYWRDTYAPNLPNTIIFWGILWAGFLFLAFLFRDTFFGFTFFTISFLIAAIPILFHIYSYYSFISSTQKYISSLSENEKHFNIIIKPGGKGIECMQGDNFSFFSWETFRGVIEKENYFSLDYRTRPFLIMKSEFSDESDINLFKHILADRFGSKAKFLK